MKQTSCSRSKASVFLKDSFASGGKINGETCAVDVSNETKAIFKVLV